MEKIVKIVGTAVLFAGAIVFLGPLSAALGWLAGWTVSLFFNDIIISALSSLGIEGVSLPHLGTLLGFVGSFLRTHTTVKKE